MEDARTGARDVPVDRRASDLELQLEQVQLTLQQLRQTHGSLQDMETRLGDMTRECADILDRWAKNDEKHATAVVELHGRLSEWNDIERRLLNESATRVHQFERSLQHEWNALRQKHEAPMQQLETQAARIAETCVKAVDQALRGFDRAEARLAALEEKLEREMGQLAGEVRGALAELRDTQALGARQPWSLDHVVRLHNELRGDEAASAPGAPAVAPAAGTLGLVATARAPRAIDATHDEPHVRHEAAFATADDGPASHAMLAEPTVAPAAARGGWTIAMVLVAAAVIGYGIYMGREFSAGLREATARADAAERDAAASRTQARDAIAAVRQAADERLATAQQAATSAQRLASIVAAPDVKRFDLVGGDATVPSAQLLWSRTHGLAFSAATLPSPPTGSVYQVWLVTRTTPASVGVLLPAADGPTSAVFPWPADLRRLVVGATVTIEPNGGSQQPTGAPWMTSRITPPPALAPTATPSAGS